MRYKRSEDINSIQIAAVQSLVDVSCLIIVDEYIPLRFRTFDKPLGASYLRLGNYQTSLLEIIVDPTSNVLRGATVTSFDAYSPWAKINETVAIKDGLPVLATEWRNGRLIDLELDFSVALRANELLVWWGNLESLSCISVFGRVRCMLMGDQLLGLWFQCLTDGEVGLLASHPSCSNV